MFKPPEVGGSHVALARQYVINVSLNLFYTNVCISKPMRCGIKTVVCIELDTISSKVHLINCGKGP